MATFTVIGTNVLNRLGLHDPGSGASASDLNYLLAIGNQMLGGWSLERPLIYTIARQAFPLSTTVPSYTVGVGGTAVNTGTATAATNVITWVSGPTFEALAPGSTITLNSVPYTVTVGGYKSVQVTPAPGTVTTNALTFTVPAPNRIEQWFFVDSTGRRTPLDPVNAQQYRAHRDLAAAAVCPDEVYYDYGFAGGLGSASFWPVPTFSGTASAEFDYWLPLASFPDLTTDIPLKDGYQNAIELNIAYLACLTAFGQGVDATTKQQIATDAPIAKQRLHDLNKENGLVPPSEQTGDPGRQLQQAQQPQGAR